MRTKLIALALPLLLATSAMATKPTPNAEQIDKMKKGADKAKGSQDHAKAKKLFHDAAIHQKRAHAHWLAAGRHWQARQNEIRAMHTENAIAAGLRRQAMLLNHEAHRLFRAEQLRQWAFNYRVRADRFMKSAHTHEENVAVAKKAIEQGEKAAKDLAGVKGFENALKDIKADIAKQKARVGSETKAAASDVAAAKRDQAQAQKWEAQAANLEKPIVAIPKITVKKLPAPKPVSSSTKDSKPAPTAPAKEGAAQSAPTAK